MTDPRVAHQAARFGDVADRYERARPLYPEQRVLDHLRRFLDTHPETACRRQLTYTRPCTLHLCQRSG
ncbi:MAG: hypothetical protein ACRDZ0_15050 [Acidimicrobiales bacterium]